MKKHSLFVDRQVPEFVRANYPLFLSFLKSYYEFLELSEVVGTFHFYFSGESYYINWSDGTWDKFYSGNQISFTGTSFNNNTFTIKSKIDDHTIIVEESLTEETVKANLVGGLLFYTDELSNFDIDTSIDLFVERIVESLYSIFDSNNLLYDKRFTIKHLNSLLNAKGEEESIKMLFRLLFNDTSTEIIYPWDQTFKSSDGVWIQPLNIKTKLNLGQISTVPTIEYKTLYLKSDPSKTIFVETFQTYYENGVQIIEFTIDRKLLINFFEVNVGDIFDFGPNSDHIHEFEVLPVLNRKVATVTDGGSGYIPGLKAYDSNGGSIVISEVDNNSPITSITVIEPGTLYSSDVTVSIISEFGTGAKAKAVVIGGTISEVIVTDGGRNYDPSNTTIVFEDNNGVGVDAIAVPVVDYTGPIKSVKVLSWGSSYPDATQIFNFDDSGDGNGIVTIGVGAYADSNGYYIGNKGQSSSILNKLHDSYYYQKYSYVVKSSASIKQWASLVKKLIHPAGTEVFGQVVIYNKDNLNMFSDSNIEDMVANRNKFRQYLVKIMDIINQRVTKFSTVTIKVKDTIDAAAGFTHRDLDKYKFNYPNTGSYNYLPLLDSVYTGQSFSMSYTGTVNEGYWNNYYSTPIRAFDSLVISDIYRYPNKVLNIQRNSYIKIYK